ncbi:hypothetical protein F8M41_019384 [Gigaspora margarita]|uniref:Uncharacterized protein n=1 Tax=Gigaspora margarita TaxID=4874 RepID=A0A8H4B5L6_GIGMA|nr:hypothetical protein F8M41_019384 [Gigaspora margarita]
MEETNCTNYSGTRIRKTNKVNDIVNQKWKENTLNDETKKTTNSETLEFILDVIEDYAYLTSNQDYSLIIQEEKAMYLGVLDAYYDLNKAIEEPFDNAIFDFNKEQENKLKVLLEEISAKYNALLQKLALKNRSPSKNSEVKLMLEKAKIKK